MKVSIYINQQEHKRDLPTSWEQVAFKDFLEIDSCGGDVIKVIALLTRIEYETLLKSRIKDMDQVIAVLGFLTKPPEPVIPATIMGYPVPKDLAFEEVQQYVDLKTYVEDHRKLTPLEHLRRYTIYCAVYACQVKHKKHDWKLVEEMADEFLQAPCTEVMGIGNFTLVKLIGLKLNINPASQKADTVYKKFKLVLISWRKISVHLARWFSWRKKLGIKKMNY
jgi:hypothetical protein